MSRADHQMKIRIPAEMKEKLENAALNNKRSMNAEVLHRLNESLEGENFLETSSKTWLIPNGDIGVVSSATLIAVAKALNENSEMLKTLNSKLKISITLEDKPE
ncbi:Arc family DNA-binding protein [Yersinia pseudotuberculosis]|uniref:Arc domain protein DNA binding domain protein n=1 Tax=Yersinia pseudotuberculosis serotype O:3 (strain YPIII) TaxID=502800 RepID=A0A0H3AZE6_YERPY|nr:Arc family DNA-binding protein [Yersinia pseudotuberculosis]AJJ08186.1 arc-like DNA binding domain protein [Yersinia pseudotuberculosis]AJJ57937.1 arc-like DNA binding domain protein [Yersinia pseudotuberculosis YPIII]AYW87244.1 Arc family DNA-binding protein [Yersinia pseudotuberculosis]